MKRIAWMVGVLVLGAAPAAHAFLGRDHVSCLWPEKPVAIDGRAAEWSDMPVLEESGLAFRAMNDASNLYLLIRGANSDGRVALSGRYRQNVTLWFLKPGLKSKLWGINLDFGRARPPEARGEHGESSPGESLTFASFGIAPEKVLPEGLEISTAALPSEMEFSADLSSQNGRQPVYEIRIPLAMIERNGKSIDVDFVTTPIGPDVKAELQGPGEEQRSGDGGHGSGSEGSPAGSEGRGGRAGRHGRGGGSPGGASRSIDLPKPLNLHLTIGLTKEPRR